MSWAMLQPARAGAPAACAARRRRPLAVQAVRHGAARREEVTFRVVVQRGQPTPLCFAHVTQRDLDSLLSKLGAVGFEMEDGKLSTRLEDLPPKGDVTLVLPPVPTIAAQVKNLQGLVDNAVIGKEQQLRAFMQDAASKEHAGTPIAVLPREPFLSLKKQNYLQLDAALKVGDTLYLGEHKLVLSEESLANIKFKLDKIRLAREHGLSPDLVAALHGVTQVKLFLAGEGVWAGLAVDELTNLAAAVGVNVVLPSGQALCLAAELAPAVQL